MATQNNKNNNKKKKEEKNLKSVMKDLKEISSKNLKKFAKNEKVKKSVDYIDKNFAKISCIIYWTLAVLMILMLTTTIVQQNKHLQDFINISNWVVQNLKIVKAENNELREQNKKLLEIIANQR